MLGRAPSVVSAVDVGPGTDVAGSHVVESAPVFEELIVDAPAELELAADVAVVVGDDAVTCGVG